MRQRFALFFLLVPLAFLASFLGCAAKPAHTAAAQSPQMPNMPTLLVTSDLHYQPNAPAVQESIVGQMAYNTQLTAALLDECTAARPNAFIICGDMTNNGSLLEHESLAGVLADMAARGVPVFVIPGNHDMGHILPEEFARLYANCGYNRAISRDKASLSYAAVLPHNIWLILLDTAQYGEAGNAPNGFIKEPTLRWLDDVLRKARKAGATPITVSHHNVLAHSEARHFSSYNIENGDRLLELLTRYKVPLHLSGHRHTRQVSTYGNGKSTLWEIVTDMPLSYPNRYTVLRFEAQSQQIFYSTHALAVSDWAKANHQKERELLHFEAYSYKLCLQKSAAMAKGALRSLDVTRRQKAEMARFFKEVSIAYYEGSLYQKKAELFHHEGYSLWKEYGGDTVYKNWLFFLLQNATQATLSGVIPNPNWCDTVLF